MRSPTMENKSPFTIQNVKTEARNYSVDKKPIELNDEEAQKALDYINKLPHREKNPEPNFFSKAVKAYLESKHTLDK